MSVAEEAGDSSSSSRAAALTFNRLGTIPKRERSECARDFPRDRVKSHEPRPRARRPKTVAFGANLPVLRPELPTLRIAGHNSETR